MPYRADSFCPRPIHGGFGINSRSFVEPTLAGGRLTTLSGSPVPSSTSGASYIYYTPHISNHISLNINGEWRDFTFAEIQGTVPSGTTDTVDYFVTNDGMNGYGSPSRLSLQLGQVWTSDTVRAEALDTIDGVRVRKGKPNWKYVGTARKNSGSMDDSTSFRGLWNMYNRVPRHMAVTETTASWTYNSATWRSANASTANRLQFVRGLDLDAMLCRVDVFAGTAAANGGPGVGVDSTTANSAQKQIGNTSANYASLLAEYLGYPGVGFHYLQWIESTLASATLTFYGTTSGGSQNTNSGISAMVMA